MLARAVGVRRLARRRGHRDAGQRGRGGAGDRAGRGIRRAGAHFLAAQLVAEAHLHLDLLARVGGGQGVGGGGLARNLRLVGGAVGVHAEPLVGEARGHPVGVHDRARVGGQLLPGLRRAGNRRLARRDGVRRQAQVHRARLHRGRPVEGCRPRRRVKCGGTAEVVDDRIADMQPERLHFHGRQSRCGQQFKNKSPGMASSKLNPGTINRIVVRADGEGPVVQFPCGSATAVSIKGGPQKCVRSHRHRAGPDLAPVAEAGHPADGDGGVRHVDGHRVGAGAVVRAVVHREGEGRIGGAVRIARGRVR